MASGDDAVPGASDEPVATGWARTELNGDTVAAQRHVRTARRLLGQMRSTYGVNARLAAGLPGGFYRSHQVLPDGTRIEASTNDGLDTIRITAPAPSVAGAPPPLTVASQPDAVVSSDLARQPGLPVPAAPRPIAPPEPERRSEDGDTLVRPPERLRVKTGIGCGSYNTPGSDSSGINDGIFLFREGEGYTAIPWSGAAASIQIEPTAVSGNGDICGYVWKNVQYPSHSFLRPFLWSEQGGFDFLDPGSSDTAFAYTISADGATVAGTTALEIDEGTLALNADACYWSVDGALHRLPSLELFNQVMTISDDGFWMAGQAGPGNLADPFHLLLGLWSRDGDAQVISRLDGLGVNIIGFGPIQLSANGAVLAWFQSDPTNTGTYYWTAGTGMVLVSATLYLSGISDDGAVIYMIDILTHQQFRWTRVDATLSAVTGVGDSYLVAANRAAPDDTGEYGQDDDYELFIGGVPAVATVMRNRTDATTYTSDIPGAIYIAARVRVDVIETKGSLDEL